MVYPVETEIKLAASPAMLEQLRTHPKLAGADETATIITTYFDTADQRLHRCGAALRIRDAGKGREQTLKLASLGGSAIHRVEWNAPVPGNLPEPSGFPSQPRATLLRMLNGGIVEPIGATRIERTTRRLHVGSSAIELVFDLGTIEAGDRQEDVCEIELELVEGHLADVISLVLELPLGPELRWSAASKNNRCHALAFGLQPAAVQAWPVRLLQSMNAARGFQAITWNCVDQLLANYPLVIASGDPEAVHQSRVAIRRLCAACSLFGDVVDDKDEAMLRAELKAVATGLARARDLHVLIGQVEAAAKTGNADATELLAHLCARRDAATQPAQAMLTAGPFQRLLFQVSAWIEGGEWLAHKGGTGGGLPLAPFAAQILTRRRRKLRKAGKDVTDMPDIARHRLRIDVKKLRYAADFFVPLFRSKAAGKPRQGFLKALVQLQDSLGMLNDMVVAAAGHGSLFADLEPIAAARLSVRFNDLLQTQGKSQRKLLKAAERWLDRVVDAPAWWKAD
jgi:inorganic triphosphatase YgiF